MNSLLEAKLQQFSDGKPHFLSLQDYKKIEKQFTDWGLTLINLGDSYYQLNQTLNLLSQSLIQENLTQGQVVVFRSVDSTNEFLLNHKEYQSGTICVSEYQTAGRGRRGRVWFSPFAQNIYFSLLWRFHLPLNSLPCISLITGLVVAESLKALGSDDIQLKWPNDIYFQGRKLGGVLIQTRQLSPQQQDVVIGIGLNYAMQMNQANDYIDQPWASLAESAVQVERNQLVSMLANNLYRTFTAVEVNGYAQYLQRWNHYNFHQNKQVCLILDNAEIIGECIGIDDQTGELLLLVNGQQQRFAIGEISLRSVPLLSESKKQ